MNGSGPGRGGLRARLDLALDDWRLSGSEEPPAPERATAEQPVPDGLLDP